MDSLAISIGTSHGAFKFKPGQKPEIRLDILHEIEKRIPGFPIVLHGSSSVPQDIVAQINRYGGKLKDSIGIPEEQLRKAAASAGRRAGAEFDLAAPGNGLGGSDVCGADPAVYGGCPAGYPNS